MNRATSATVCSNAVPPSRDRARPSADVSRWVAMIDAELHSEDSAAAEADAVTVTLEFGRTTIDLAAQPLKPGDSLRLDQLADEPLDVVVDGRPIARGELVEVDGQLGVRIVELLMLAVAWFVFGASTSLADERPRDRAAVKSFDEQPDVFQTPFGTVRSSRGIVETDNVSAAPAKIFNERLPSELTPLPRRSDAASRDSNRAHSNGATGWSATLWPLLFVVGLIVLGTRWLKSRTPSAARGLPNEVFEVLGRQAIDPRTSVVLARCGSRLLVLSSSPHGLRTLAEITDPVEIDCLAGLCQTTPRDQTLAEMFRSLLHKPSSSKPTNATPTNPTPTNSLGERLAARLSSPRTVSSTSQPEVRA